jgi:hypothetical protein
MRRVMNTFGQQWPLARFYSAPSRDEPSVEMLPRMLQEVARLKIYGDKGDILPTTFPNRALLACVELLKIPGMPEKLTEVELATIRSLLN